MATTPEGIVKKAIKRWLAEHGAWFFMPIGGPYSVAGIPDFVGCWRGRFFAIEAKALGKKRTATLLQQACLAAIKAAGGVAILADCIEDVERGFNEAQIEHANKTVRETT